MKTFDDSAKQDMIGNCPVCGVACEDDPLCRYSYERAAAHFCPPSRNRNRNQRLRECIRRLWIGDSCTVMRCGECGFGFTIPFVGGDEEFYGILHEQKSYPSWRWDYDVARKEVLVPLDAGKILDIGAGDGLFLRSLDGNWERFAVEGSEDTRTELEKMGIQVLRDLASATETEMHSFDIVTLFQTLEHIADFRTVLKQARDLLAPGGKILITVPNGDNIVRLEQVTGCPDMPPNHVCQWTTRSLSLALEEAGFSPGTALEEPPSLRNVRRALHLKVLADAARPQSLSTYVYRIPKRAVRIPFLAFLGCVSLIKLLPHVDTMRKGNSFSMVGSL